MRLPLLSGSPPPAPPGGAAVWILLLLGLTIPLWPQSASPMQDPGLPSSIPIFPLDDVVLFPDALRPLHIFEPRYRALVADALEGDRVIGMVLLRPGFESTYQGRPAIYPVGCAGRITGVEQLPDGRYNILLQGLVKFRVLREQPGRPYRLAQVQALPEAPDPRQQEELSRLRPRLEELLTRLVSGAAPSRRSMADPELVSAMAQYLELPPGMRQELLELRGPLSRALRLIELLERRLDPPPLP